MPMWGMAIAAAAGIAKSELIDKPKAEKRRQFEAEKERWSPWTGQHGQYVSDPDSIGAGLQYGAVGAQIGQGYNQQQEDKKLSESLRGYYDRQGNMGKEFKAAGGAGDTMQKPGTTLEPDVSATPGRSPASANAEPAWFYGDNPSPYAQPSKSMLGAQPDSTAGYKALYDSGVNPDAPSYFKSPNPWR